MKSTLKHPIALMVVAPLLCIFAIAAYSLWHLYDSQRNLQEVRQGIQATVDSLPELQDFEPIQTKFEKFSVSAPKQISDFTCYYGRATIMLGTNKPESDAFNEYVNALQEGGWTSDDLHSYPSSMVLQRGDQEQMNIISREPAFALRKYMDLYSVSKDKYLTIIIIMADYKSPNVAKC